MNLMTNYFSGMCLLNKIFLLALSEFLEFPEDDQPVVCRCNELLLDLLGCIDANV